MTQGGEHFQPPSRLSQQLRGFGPVGIGALILVILGNGLFVPLSAILVLVWAHLSNTPVSDLGLRRPLHPIRDVAVGLVVGIAFKLLFKSVIMPVLGAPPTNPYFAYITGNTQALFALAAVIVVGAGFGEELVFRGFLFERIRSALPRSDYGATVALVFSSLVFGAVHIPSQGIYGAEQATLFGLILGAVYLRSKSLLLPMLIHASFDLTAALLIYFGVEPVVSTFFGF